MKKFTHALLVAGMVTGLAGAAHAATDMQTSNDMSINAAGKISREDVKNLQQTLMNRGYKTGPVDGMLGPKTAEAVRNFQRDNGLPVTGSVNSETATQLGLNIQNQQSGYSADQGLQNKTNEQVDQGVNNNQNMQSERINQDMQSEDTMDMETDTNP